LIFLGNKIPGKGDRFKGFSSDNYFCRRFRLSFLNKNKNG
jgi:hypothetical protein